MRFLLNPAALDTSGLEDELKEMLDDCKKLRFATFGNRPITNQRPQNQPWELTVIKNLISRVIAFVLGRASITSAYLWLVHTYLAQIFRIKLT